MQPDEVLKEVGAGVAIAAMVFLMTAAFFTELASYASQAMGG